MPLARVKAFAARELPWIDFDWSILESKGGANWARQNFRTYLTTETKGNVKYAPLKDLLEKGSDPAELNEPTTDGGG